MAQLTDDCFAFGGKLTQVDEALDQLKGTLNPSLKSEQVPLVGALNRILAENIISPENVPADNNSAVDGFSIYYDDIQAGSETKLPVSGRAIAGVPLGRLQNRGEAVQILTGALMPDGPDGQRPDTVVMKEDCLLDDGAVLLPEGIYRGANCRLMAEDVQCGETILEAGCRLRPQEIGLAASIGCGHLPVMVPLKVAVFSTGNEVLDPGDSLFKGAIYDSNRFTLMQLLKSVGCEVNDLGILEDDPKIIADALLSASTECDLILTSGGVSTGEEDHVRKVVEKEGSLFFWRLAIKPGRPVALGQINDTVFIGLPGNPVAAMVTFLQIARPIILKLSGANDSVPKSFLVQSNFSYKKKLNRREYVRVQVKQNGNGKLTAEKCIKEGAGILSSMVFADGFVELSEDIVNVEKGDFVNYIPFSELGL
jgi:molybdopterin molybdotransferase